MPTIRFQTLYVFLVLAHQRRRIVHFRGDRPSDCPVDCSTTAGSLSLGYCAALSATGLHRIFGKDFVDPVKAMGIQQVLSAPRSPWQRVYVERVIGTIRPKCLDHMIVSARAACIDIFIRHYSVRAQTLTLRYVHSGGVALQVGRFEQSARHRRPAGETGIACPARGESATRGNN